MLEKLWDGNMGFFKTFVTEKNIKTQTERYNGDNAYINQPLGLSPVPELYGYVPWYYGVMDTPENSGDYLKAWRLITDPDYFAGPAGLATAPISHPDFMRPHHHECAWDGPSWPYATCQALGAMARMLRNLGSGRFAPVDSNNFINLTGQYAAAHRLKLPDEREIDWIDENYCPLTGEWLALTRLYEWDDANKDRGQYYNHSTFCDLIISDVIGLQPGENGSITVQPMIGDWDYFYMDNVFVQGRRLTVFYDKDGTRYNRGAGLTVLVDGSEAGRLDELGKLEIKMNYTNSN
jgi:hypothetical protein